MRTSRLGGRRRIAYRLSLRALGLVLVFALLLAACGVDDDGDDAASDSSQPATGEDEPQQGGEITIGTAFLVGLDPSTGVPYGCCGGSELVAVYDTLMDYDRDSGEYVEQTAESVTSNDEFTEWTVTIKPDITFTDGTAYNAEAVKLSYERNLQPRSQDSVLLNSFIDSVTVVDPLTVRFDLKLAWAGFPVLLAGPMGMVASPEAIDAAEADGGQYGTNDAAVGAGPFKVVSFVPNESLELVPNPDYWGDQPNLDKIKVVTVAVDTNPIDSMDAGTLDAIVTVRWRYIAAAEEAGYPQTKMLLRSGLGLMFNSGTYVCGGVAPGPPGLCDGKAEGTEVKMDTPTADPRVRRAAVLAINRELYNDRCFAGEADLHNALYPQFLPDYDGPSYDPDGAKRLVEEAKAEGWDGHIRFVASNSPGEMTCNQTVVTMLKAVGMDAELDLRPSSESLQAVQSERDFDVTATVSTQGEENPFMHAWRNLQNYRYGYDSPAMDEALTAIRTASTEQEIQAGYRMLADVIVEDAPAAIIGSNPRSLIHVPELRGLSVTSKQNVRFEGAWLDKAG